MREVSSNQEWSGRLDRAPPGARVTPGTTVTLRVSAGPHPNLCHRSRRSEPPAETELPDDLVGLWHLHTEGEALHELTVSAEGAHELIDHDGSIVDAGIASVDGNLMTDACGSPIRTQSPSSRASVRSGVVSQFFVGDLAALHQAGFVGEHHCLDSAA